MKFYFKPFKTVDHYRTISGWWAEEEFPAPISPKYLPAIGLGIFESSRLIACCFLYMTGTKLCWLEWITVARRIRRADRTRVINRLLEGVAEIARGAGCDKIFMSTKHPSLLQRLQKMGFEAAEVGMTNLYCGV